MWRTVLALSLLLTLALGAAADAKCRVCVQSLNITRGDGMLALSVTAVSDEGFTFPDSAKMFFDKAPGEVVLQKTPGTGTTATYTGKTATLGTSAVAAISGRVDIGGDVFSFNAPANGAPATTQLIGAAAAQQYATNQTVPAAAITPTTTAVSIPGAPAPASAPVSTAIVALAAAVAAALVGAAYLGRRRVTALLGALIGS